ncbi:MAG: hypothetical protein K6G00_10355 [Treponema sp.]|nr:hypothetical protein [Treponema sp.]
MKKITFIKCSTVICAMLLSLMLFSCATTEPSSKVTPAKENTQEQTSKAETSSEEKSDKPAPVKAVPTITYKGRGVKIEAEEMLLEGSSLYKDSNASKGYAIKLPEHSIAKCKVVLSPGTWECLVSEQAFNTNKSELFVNISGTYYKVYPSNPPLGTWELTTRSPIYIHLDQETTLNVSINADSPYETGSGGMNIDYIQFVRTN